MEYCKLPRHDLPMDEALPSEVIVDSDGIEGYRWVLTNTERAHIADMVQMNATDLALRGNIMNRERSTCKGCGKQSGLDDLVHNAVYAGIHSASFIVDVLTNGPKGPSPPHNLTCSRCATEHEGLYDWQTWFWDA